MPLPLNVDCLCRYMRHVIDHSYLWFFLMNYIKITNNKNAAREMITKHYNKSTATRKRGEDQWNSHLNIKLVLQLNPRE